MEFSYGTQKRVLILRPNESVEKVLLRRGSFSTSSDFLQVVKLAVPVHLVLCQGLIEEVGIES